MVSSLQLPEGYNAEWIDGLFIDTGLSHLLENEWFNEETGNVHFELEDTRTVIIEPDGSVSVVDALEE